MNTLINTVEAAAYMSVSQDFLKRARVTGKGPVFVKIGRKVLYRLKDIDAFIEKHICRNLSTIKQVQNDE